MANPFEEEMSDELKENQLATLATDKMSYSDIAGKLISDNLLLTALELHAELIEAGREVPKLKEFFSNPGNFEPQAASSRLDISNSIRRSSSQVTLDSLDLTRFSEDGERGIDERVAVLEFELRKAKETISALRTNLTVAAESESTTPESGTNKLPNNEIIKPHEQRALNFLLNEYLMLHNYKLTSITFADENEDQDFEDWDDVGLNIPKPAELLNIYRDFLRQTGMSRSPCVHASCQTELPSDTSLANETMHLELLEAIERLKERVNALDHEKDDLRRLLTMERMQDVSSIATPASDTGVVAANETTSLHSGTPERFELIEAEIKAADETDGKRDDDGTISLADTDTEWTRVAIPNPIAEQDVAVPPCEEALLHGPIGRSLPPRFHHEVFTQCFVNTARHQEKHQLGDIAHDDITEKKLVYILGTCLPRIIPNIILNKREEVLPLIIACIHLHPEVGERDRLLHLLFNLKKRPQEEERLTILAGIVSLARCSGLSLVENEILPQCWEQIAHRHIERRLLVAESCSALAPYVSSPIRNSLMLSMLQQMLLEDKSELVRESVVRSLALIVTFIDDSDKYFQCEQLALTALDDAYACVSDTSARLFLPVLAKWALDLGRLQDRLIAKLVDKLHGTEKHVKAVEKLIPYVVISVVCVDHVLETITDETPRFECRMGEGLTDPNVFYDGEFTVGTMMGAFDCLLAQECYEEWAEVEWACNTFLPSLLDIVQAVDAKDSTLVSALVSLFHEVCCGFGSVATRRLVRPQFTVRLQHLEKCLASGRAGNDAQQPSLAIIPVYLVGVLATQQEVDELGPMLKRFLFGLPLCGCPLHALHASVSGLCMTQRDVVLAALWDAVVHPRPAVRLAAAALLVTAAAGDAARVLPALVTLASDADITVRTATVPALGALVISTNNKEVHDKTYMQLQSFLTDPVTRDDHGMQLQLVNTMGHMVATCEPWFREEVILPQLAAMAASTLHMSNLTKRLDLANALMEAFSSAVYCSLSKQTISTALLPGLRYLEAVCSQSLPAHLDTVCTMIRSAESRVEPTRPPAMSLALASSNVGQGMEDMKKRMSNIFTNKPSISRPTNLPNLQGMFRKK